MNYNFTYILRCRDGSFYTGWTNDMKNRYEAHVSGKGGKYTKSHPPVGIIYLEISGTKEEAMRREFAIKQLTRPQKKAMIEASGWQDSLPPDLRETLAEYIIGS